RALRLAFKHLERDQQRAAIDPVGAALADPEQAFYWDTAARYFGGGRLRPDQRKLVDELFEMKGLDPSTTLGDALLPIPVSTDVFNLLLVYGAFRFLGARPMQSTKTKFAKV